MSALAIELSNVSCQFGAVRAVEDITLTIATGERVALVGPSGAGKSTLLGLINGAIWPSEGDVNVLGRSLYALSTSQRRKIQQRIGTVYQQHHLIGNLQVIHNVNAGQLGRWPLWRSILSLLWPQQTEVAAAALSQLGMDGQLYARTDRLSGGQQQRVALARVLVQDPVIVLADEPTASLDPARSHDILSHLVQLGTDRTLLMSLHEVDLALKYCDRIIALRQGRLVFDQPVDTVTDQQLTELYRLEEADSDAEPSARASTYS